MKLKPYLITVFSVIIVLAAVITLVGTVAVSYTHLDVYKRQMKLNRLPLPVNQAPQTSR